jgi:DNA-binding CsgD family transcriptional regulator
LDASFVGRGSELDRLLIELDLVRNGHPRAVLLTGEPGIGKTALARQFLRGSDLLILEASGEEAESLLAYGIIDQLLRVTSVTLPDALVGVGAPGAEPRDPIWVGAGLLELLGSLQSPAPVVIVIDDAQWADRPSVQSLVFALRRLQADRLFALFISRRGSSRGLLAGIHRLVEHGRGAWLRLAGLDVTAIRELGASMGVEHLSVRAAERIRVHTGGNPLHTRAVFEELSPDILRQTSDLPLPSPSDFADLVLERLAACPPDAQKLVQAASVLGMRCRLSLAGQLADLEDPLPPFEQTVTAHLLEEHGDPRERAVAFTHPLVQAATYHDLGPARRAQLHARAAGLVQNRGAALKHRVAAAPGDDPQLAADLAEFGDREAGRGAWESAADTLMSASRLTPASPERDARLLDAAKYMLLGGGVADAVGLADEIASLPATPRRGYVLGSLALMAGRYEEAQRLLTKAYELCNLDIDHQLAEDIGAQLAHVHMGRGNGAEAAAWASRSLDAKRGPSPVSDSLSMLAIGLVFAGRAFEGLAAVERLPESPLPDDDAPLDGFLGRGYARLVTDDPAGACADLATIAVQLRSRGPAHLAISALVTLSAAEYRLGAWDDAILHGQLAASIGEDADHIWLLSSAHAAACAPLAARGDWEAATAHVGAARRAAVIVRAEFASVAQAAMAEAWLARARGDDEGVVGALEPILPLADLDGVREPGILDWQVLYASALVGLDRLRDAETVLARFDRLAAERERKLSMASAARVRGMVEAAWGRTDDAEVAFLTSLAILDDMHMPFERALTELDYGRVLRRAGHARAAAWQLSAARERFTDLDASPYLEHCDRELAACGIGPTEAPNLARGRLTPQEISVSRLVASGRTNREIAAELVVSVKTVEYHLGNVYGKLGIRSRHELPSAVFGPQSAPGPRVPRSDPRPAEPTKN